MSSGNNKNIDTTKNPPAKPADFLLLARSFLLSAPSLAEESATNTAANSGMGLFAILFFFIYRFCL
jgi:hypothetical protein